MATVRDVKLRSCGRIGVEGDRDAKAFLDRKDRFDKAKAVQPQTVQRGIGCDLGRVDQGLRGQNARSPAIPLASRRMAYPLSGRGRVFSIAATRAASRGKRRRAFCISTWVSIFTAGYPSRTRPAGALVKILVAAAADHVIADKDVVIDAALPAHHHPVANAGRPGHADLTAEQTIAADLDVVADVDKVIQLGARADGGVADGAFVDAGIGADFHIIPDGYSAQ